MNARDRFEPPSADAESDSHHLPVTRRSKCVSECFVSEPVARPQASWESIEDAKTPAGESKIDKREILPMEAHTDAAARSLAVWGWLFECAR